MARLFLSEKHKHNLSLAMKRAYAEGRKKKNFSERKLVIITEMLDNGCDIVKNHIHKGGRYPQIWKGGNRWLLHRYVYEKLNGKIANGNVIMHICDNPRCIRPDHLKEGSQLENMRDAANKNRIARGVRCGNVKIDEGIAAKIREEGGSTRKVGEKYGISGTVVSKIRRGILWRLSYASAGAGATGEVKKEGKDEGR